MNRLMILAGMGIGAGLMYALDPQQGNRRRALARDKLAKAVHKTGHAVGATSRDVAHRATGLAASVQSRFFEDNAPDDVVEARVRARLGRVSSHPGSIEVAAQNGVITLRGPVFTSEVKDVVRAISSVRGVQRVENQLEPHDVHEHVPALQGRPPLGGEGGRNEWSPTAKLAIGLAGTTLASIGMVRHDRLGMVLGGIGLALVLRSIGDPGIERLFAPASRRDKETADSSSGVKIPVKIGPRTDNPSPWSTPPEPGRVH